MDSQFITFLKCLYWKLWLQHVSTILCLSEMFLDSLLNLLDDRINIEGYNLPRIDHPNSNQRGGICMF